ncbi:MAG: STAS domain-containing protein [Novosphingobium sp.]
MIKLPARCDRAAVLALAPELRAAVSHTAMQIDGSAVEQVGQALLQLLVSARRSEGGAQIIASPALAEAARATGLSEALFDGAIA